MGVFFRYSMFLFNGRPGNVVIGTVCFCLFLLLGGLIFPTGPLNASRLDDLNLADRLEQALDESDRIKDPHGMDCETCHEVVDVGGVYKDHRLKGDIPGICRQCHDQCTVHPMGVVPVLSEPRAKDSQAPESSPSATNQKRIPVACPTCHYIHKEIDLFRRGLIKGDSREDRGYFRAICTPCHSDGLNRYSPHRSEGDSCHLCHEKDPASGQSLDEILHSNPSHVCNFCHGMARRAHYLTVNPFVDSHIQWNENDIDIPLLNGRFTCVSCHDPHAEERKDTKLLREDYLALVRQSNHVNPHWRNIMCQTCHEGRPEKGKPRLLFGGDVNSLCNRCHNNEFARTIIHPVGVAPTSSVKIPSQMPLEEGKITCRTCHNSSLQESGEENNPDSRYNPMFLRGGLTVRNEFCFRCHIQDLFSSLNAHNQLTTEGTVREEACLCCHTYNPRDKVMGIENLTGFRDKNPLNYCVWCHSSVYFRERHPAGAHMLEPPREIIYNMEETFDRTGASLPLYDGVITCITCHDPHQRGALDIEEVAGGDIYKRLRLGNRHNTCVGCHGDK